MCQAQLNISKCAHFFSKCLFLSHFCLSCAGLMSLVRKLIVSLYTFELIVRIDVTRGSDAIPQESHQMVPSDERVFCRERKGLEAQIYLVLLRQDNVLCFQKKSIYVSCPKKLCFVHVESLFTQNTSFLLFKINLFINHSF